MVLQVFVSKHSSVVCQQHPVDKLKAGEQFSPSSQKKKKKTWKVQGSNRKCHVEDEWFSSGRTLNYCFPFWAVCKLEAWKVKIMLYMALPCTDYDIQMFGVLSYEVWVVVPTWRLCLEHIIMYICTVNALARVNCRILFESHINCTHQLGNS